VARHPDRPHSVDYIGALVEEFTPLAGDRAFADDRAIIGGIGRFRGRSVVVIGHEKGADTATRMRHNFGMARPEGYRKAQRLMDLADRFHLPVVTLVDTPGAYPGVDAEARGQAEAIARCIETCLKLRVRSCGDHRRRRLRRRHRARRRQPRTDAGTRRLFRDLAGGLRLDPLAQRRGGREAAAEALKLTAQDLLQLGIIDQIVPEPMGGAHRDKPATIDVLGDGLEKMLIRLLTAATSTSVRSGARNSWRWERRA